MPAASPAAFLLRRLITVAGVVLATTTAAFLFFHLMRPERFAGDPRPLLKQLWDYLTAAVLHFDLGVSWQRPHPEVSDLIRHGLPGDLWLLGGSLVLGVVGGTAGGAICATRPRSLAAHALGVLAAFALCAPVYWVGLMAVLVFTPGVGPLGISFFPVASTYAGLTEDPLRWLQAMWVPWIILALPIAAMCQRMMAASMLEVLDEDYLRTAAAKGLHPRTVLRRHAVPAASAPVIALVGVNMAVMVTNLVLIEQVFNVPGTFRLSTQAMEKGDLPVLQGIVVVGAVLVVVANLAADLVHAWLDPRIRA
jgi:peptide/nickel transport system permease protein